MNMSKLEKYSSYKESGVESLGKIPEEWEIKRFKYMFFFNKGLTITKENLTNRGIHCINYGEIHSKYGFEVNPEIHELKYVDEKYLQSNPKSLLNFGDFVFADTSEDIEGSGNFTYLNSPVKTFAGYHTVICRLKKENNPRFFAYIIDSISYRFQIRKRVKGVKVYSITQGILKDTFVWIPSQDEQTKIVEFLDIKTEQLNKTIEQKEQLIERLKERRQILINDAVTKGIDKTVTMKDTNFKWLGKIPEHWEFKTLKYILKERIERSDTGDETLFMMSQIYGLVVRSDYHNKAVVAQSSIGNKKVYKNDLVFNKLKAHLGVFSKSNIDEVGIVSPDYAVYYSIGDIPDLKYLEHLFKNQIYISHFISKARYS